MVVWMLFVYFGGVCLCDNVVWVMCEGFDVVVLVWVFVFELGFVNGLCDGWFV